MSQWDEIQRLAYFNPIRPILKHWRSAENISELANPLPVNWSLPQMGRTRKWNTTPLMHLVTAVQALGDTDRQNTHPDTGMANWVEAVLHGTDILLQAWPDTCSDAERPAFAAILQLRVAVLESRYNTCTFKEQIDALEPESAVVPIS